MVRLGRSGWAIGLLCGGGLAVAAAVTSTIAAGAEPAPSGFSLPKVDEAFTTGLDDFRRYCDKRQWDAAFKAVSKVLEQPASGFVATDDDILLPGRQRLRTTLLTLPAEGRNAYRLFFDAQAKRLLEKATAAGADDVATLNDIVDHYFLTASGVAAADRLGDAEFEAGRFVAAADQWKLILDHAPEPPADAARLHVKRGLALARAGQHAAVDELIRVVESKFAGEHIRIGGRTQEAAAFLRETRSATTASSTAATEETVRVPADGKAAWRSVFMSDTLAEEFSTTMQQTGWGRYMTSPDTHVPAAAVDAARVYVNWIGVVFAVDLRTGKLVWRTEKFSRFNGQTMSVVQSGMDAAACTITAADGRVFVVGTPAPPNGGTPSGNTLRCLDGATGKVLWNTQNAMGPTGTAVGRMVAGAFSGPTAAPDAAAAGKVSATPLSQYTFTSTALIDGPTLYVVGAPQGQANLELIAIDVAKGGKLWSLPLGAAVAGQNFRGQMQLPSAVLRMDSGTLYVLTNNGALLCVDTADQTVRWALRTEGPPQSDRENMIFFSNSVPAPVIEPPGEIVLSGGRLYIKEKATRLLYALDPSGPKLLWKRPLGKDQGIAGDRAGRLLTTGAAAEAIDAATHALLWSTPLSAKTGQMRPVFAGRTMLVQSARGIFMIDTNTGDVLKVFRSPDTAAVGANLLVSGDRLISVSNRSVTAYALVDEAAAK